MSPFVPRQRKHKVLQRQKDQRRRRIVENGDPNAAEILPAEEAERKTELRDTIRAEAPQISSKKKKRLDKYIVRVLLLGIIITLANAFSTG